MATKESKCCEYLVIYDGEIDSYDTREAAAVRVADILDDEYFGGDDITVIEGKIRTFDVEKPRGHTVTIN